MGQYMTKKQILQQRLNKKITRYNAMMILLYTIIIFLGMYFAFSRIL